MALSLQKMYRRLRYGKPIVVVSGLPRSGTSMAMKMLEAGGMELVIDGIRTADEDNPKGYYELEQVKDLDKEDRDNSWLPQCRGRAVKIISFLLAHLPASNDYKILFMRRNLHEVLASQTKMLKRRDESSETSDEKMLELWQSHLAKIKFQLRYRPHFDAIDIVYREVCDSPAAAARLINDFVGGNLDEERMAAVVDKQLYRNRA